MAFALTAATLFLGGGVLFLAGVVLVRFMREWRRTPGRTRLLPLHVWLVAGSYLLLVLLMILGAITGYASQADWRAAIRIPALSMGLVSLFVLVNFQTKTYSHTRRRHAELRDAASRGTEDFHPDGR